ncbi:uncharacterized protein F4822DRAFT_406241 [Hypoxylon trugodes]|uniref:uncharacterized protein n=1 Tax=Hypoxylon trugodes TaxID=326681 RepID=UPI0021A062D7|nr:uncharacterized protein F4822DRAFT_406241 [Hypoxylon trugodes]KAI1387373.1 hypothetical protein F4822DRAFT_406241 [Hypoxylon trugodes]
MRLPREQNKAGLGFKGGRTRLVFFIFFLPLAHTQPSIYPLPFPVFYPPTDLYGWARGDFTQYRYSMNLPL